ncbi:MAG: hypothetical protein FWF86_08560 [Clostridia bacterium]|nr:hypothetical protein [Clostridia bacterium]
MDCGLDAVLEALKAMRAPFLPYEADIHKAVEERLGAAALSYSHEAVIGKGCRIDYLVGSVGIEVKKGKPLARVLHRQLQRYASCESVSALVLVTQRHVRLPGAIGGKPVEILVLPQLWGVALP